MVFLLTLPPTKLGGALGHPVVNQAVVTQIVLFHNIKPSLTIGHHVTCVGWISFLAKHTSLLPNAIRVTLFLGTLVSGGHMECRSCRLRHTVTIQTPEYEFPSDLLPSDRVGSTESWSALMQGFSECL